MDFRAVAIRAIAIARDTQFYDLLLAWLHLYAELIRFLLTINTNELFLLQCHRLAQVLILFGVVAVVVVDISSDAAGYAFDVYVACIVVDPFLFSELLMQQHYFVQEFIVRGWKLLIFGDLNTVLSIE